MKLAVRDDRFAGFERLGVGVPSLTQRSGISALIDSAVARAILTRISEEGLDRADDSM